MTTLLSKVFFVIVDCSFIAMSHFCIGSLRDFCRLFAFVFSSSRVYLCSHLPCTFDGWVPSLVFIYRFFFYSNGYHIEPLSQHLRVRKNRCKINETHIRLAVQATKTIDHHPNLIQPNCKFQQSNGVRKKCYKTYTRPVVCKRQSRPTQVDIPAH
jgi:hypothetical protein